MTHETLKADAEIMLAKLDDSNTVSRLKNEQAAELIRRLLSALNGSVSLRYHDDIVNGAQRTILEQEGKLSELTADSDKAMNVILALKKLADESGPTWMVPAQDMYDVIARTAAS